MLSGKRWNTLLLSLSLAQLTGCGAVGGTSAENTCTLDADFHGQLGTGFTGEVNSIAVQEDGRILVGGAFSEFQGAAREGLVRLESTGVVDAAFLGATSFNDSVFALALKGDDIFAAGAFTTVNGTSAPRIVKLDAAGDLDSTFAAALGSGPSSHVSSLAIDSAGRLIAGGDFTSVGATSASHLARLSDAGAVDTAFQATLGSGCNLGVDEILVLAGDDYLLGGSFSTCQGAGPSRLFRLDETGTAAATFNAGVGSGFDNGVRALIERAGGGYLVGGAFEFLDSASVRHLVALKDDGTLDDSFNALKPSGVDAEVYALHRQANGKLLVGGELERGLLRLNEDGSEDTDHSFQCGTGFNGIVRAVLELEDGSLLVGGDFTRFQNTTVGGLARLR